jgi:hypothetical protein
VTFACKDHNFKHHLSALAGLVERGQFPPRPFALFVSFNLTLVHSGKAFSG